MTCPVCQHRAPRATFRDVADAFYALAAAETEDQFRRAENRARVALWRYAVRLLAVHEQRGRQRSQPSTRSSPDERRAAP